jgi:hypothetical protein
MESPSPFTPYHRCPPFARPFTDGGSPRTKSVGDHIRPHPTPTLAQKFLPPKASGSPAVTATGSWCPKGHFSIVRIRRTLAWAPCHSRWRITHHSTSTMNRGRFASQNRMPSICGGSMGGQQEPKFRIRGHREAQGVSRLLLLPRQRRILVEDGRQRRE